MQNERSQCKRTIQDSGADAAAQKRVLAKLCSDLNRTQKLQRYSACFIRHRSSPFDGFRSTQHSLKTTAVASTFDGTRKALLPEAQIWRSASELVQRYGRQADFQAALRAARHLIKEDLKAHDTWMRIVRAIIRLQAASRSETMQ